MRAGFALACAVVDTLALAVVFAVVVAVVLGVVVVPNWQSSKKSHFSDPLLVHQTVPWIHLESTPLLFVR